MKLLASHSVMTDDVYPLDYPYEEYLKDRVDLTRFYYNNGGSTWGDNTGWLTSSDHCADWFGVTCNDDHRVTSIIMTNNGVSGDYPEDLSSLDFLSSIHLTLNSLDG